MTPIELESLADAAAERAVSRTLLAIGVDVSSSEGVLGAQRDAAFVRTARLTVRRIGFVIVAGLTAASLALFGIRLDWHL